jgi:hypothetical protein
MPRSHRWFVVAFSVTLTALLAASGRGDSTDADKAKEKKEKKKEEKWLLDRALTVSPRAETRPAVKYRLYPLASERKEGNAVPIYLRFAHERSDATKTLLREKTEQWLAMPLDKMPISEVREFMDRWKYNLKQMDLAARRTRAEWNYTLDAGDIIGLLLPDAQEMRIQARLLVLKARLEIAEGRIADASRTLETGFSFSRQVSQGPFLINSLVGIACASQFQDVLLDGVERTDAPNLYWSLTELPRPLIDLRHAMEEEYRLVEKQFPDMADLHRPRANEEWDATLRRVRKELERILQFDPAELEKVRKPGSGANDPADKSPDLPVAKNYLIEVTGLPESDVNAMPASRVLLLYLSHYFHELRDDMFKGAYVTYADAPVVTRAAQERLKAAPDTEPGRLARYLLPAIPKVMLAQARVDRRTAMLRVIEALRIHAAAHNGELPEKLSDITAVPIPSDPGADKPFEYHRDGATATLASRIPSEPLESTGLRFRITMRK